MQHAIGLGAATSNGQPGGAATLRAVDGGVEVELDASCTANPLAPAMEIQ